MATSSDALLLRAMTQFGGGLGSMMGRRRQNRQNEELFANMLPSDAQAPQVTTPGTQDLTSAMLGTIPGMGAAATGLNAAMTGAQGQIDASTAQRNQGNARMQQMAKDPQMAAMLKQGIAQSQMASMMPKKPQKISDQVMSVADGVMIMDQKTGTLKFQKTKDEGITKVLKPGDIVWDKKTGEIAFQAPKSSSVKSWLSEESRMSDSGVPETKPVIIFEDGSRVEAGPWGPSSKAFSISSPVMGTGERAKWRDKIEDTRRSLREFGEIRTMFDPEFLTTAGRARSGFGEVAARFNVLDKFPGEKERYSDRNEFFAAVSDRANRYIKEITGAQMSEAEAKRLLTAIPNVKDDPVAFSNKLDRVIAVSESALNQYEEVLWSTQSEDAAIAAADRVVREMMGDSDPSFIE